MNISEGKLHRPKVIASAIKSVQTLLQLTVKLMMPFPLGTGNER